MSKFVRLFFNRKKNASKEVAGAIEIVICLQRERAYFHTGHCVCIDVFKAVAAQSPAIKDTKSYARWIRSVQEYFT